MASDYELHSTANNSASDKKKKNRFKENVRFYRDPKYITKPKITLSDNLFSLVNISGPAQGAKVQSYSFVNNELANQDYA